MGVLSTLFGSVVAFVAGFFCHVVAHDFCEFAPMISKKLVEAAASRLPKSIRDRYLEEWRADLLDQPGAIAKLGWSIGCFRSAYRMQREARVADERRSSFGFAMTNGEIVMLDVPSLMSFYFAFRFVGIAGPCLRRVPGPIRLPLAKIGLRLVLQTAKFQWRQCGSPNYDAVEKLLMHFLNGTAVPTSVTKYFDGKPTKTTSARDLGLLS
jgi:hypothetical protein